MDRPVDDVVQPIEIALHPAVALAKQAVEAYVNAGVTIKPPPNLSGVLLGQAGVFVCIKERHRLRGCIGTLMPRHTNVAEEIITNAISSAANDPRFPPVSAAELPHLTYSVDILTSPEPITGLAELDPKRYGVIVRHGYRQGLLLPDLEGVDTAAEQVRIARAKAGIGEHEPVELFRFEVQRFE